MNNTFVSIQAGLEQAIAHQPNKPDKGVVRDVARRDISGRRLDAQRKTWPRVHSGLTRAKHQLAFDAETQISSQTLARRVARDSGLAQRLSIKSEAKRRT